MWHHFPRLERLHTRIFVSGKGNNITRRLSCEINTLLNMYFVKLDRCQGFIKRRKPSVDFEYLEEVFSSSEHDTMEQKELLKRVLLCKKFSLI